MANITVNRLNTTISPADETTLLTGFTGINTVLGPYLATLTDDERKSLFSLKEENLVFAHEALLQAQNLGNLIPAAMGSLVTNLDNDLELNKQMGELEDAVISQLVQKISDTRRLAGHEGYVGALAVYKLIEALASVGVEGAQAAYDILKARFANQGGTPPIVTP
jgi:hypothetical protein